MNTCKKRPVIDVAMLRLKDEFLTQYERKGYTYDTIRTYGESLEIFLIWMKEKHLKEVQEITLEILEEYRLFLVRGEYKSATIELRLRTVRGFFRFLENTGHIFINPASDLKLFRPERILQAVPSENEMLQLLNAPDLTTHTGIRNKALIEVCYSTGVRVGELLKMEIKDINKNVIKVFGKGRKTRMVPLTGCAIESLDIYLSGVRPLLIKEATEILWLNISGRPLTKVAVQQMLRKYQTKTGIKTKLSIHAIRRATATHLLRHGMSPLELQLLLGHESLGTLSQYLAVSVAELKSMHERSRLGQ